MNQLPIEAVEFLGAKAALRAEPADGTPRILLGFWVERRDEAINVAVPLDEIDRMIEAIEKVRREWSGEDN